MFFARREQLNVLCGLKWKRAPAHTSLRYALQGLEPAEVERAFREHATHLAQSEAGSQIAFDGKTARQLRSFRGSKSRSALQRAGDRYPLGTRPRLDQ
jgi:hypothetical protein